MTCHYAAQILPPVPGFVTLVTRPQFNVSCFADCPPRPGVVFPGAGDLGLPPRRLCVPAVNLETPGHLQTGSGSVCLRAAPEALHNGHAAVGVVHEAPTGCLHRLLPPGQTESDVHRNVCLAVVHTGAQGKRERQRKAGLTTNILKKIIQLLSHFCNVDPS